jgi:HK97 family phage prohead protease
VIFTTRKENQMPEQIIEQRTFKLELRQEPGRRPRIGGYAARYNQLSYDLGGYRERILPGAFAKNLKSSELRCFALINHDSNRCIGKCTSDGNGGQRGNLSLRDDGTTGLQFDCELPDTTDGNDLAELCSRGIASECSFAFIIDKDSEDWDDDQDYDDPITGERCRGTIRTIGGFRKLTDVSVLTCGPAYPGTGASMRSLREAYEASMDEFTRNAWKRLTAIKTSL